jgi:prepilin signal peptidase PulO-like enzyme (type II secretory pathway)
MLAVATLGLAAGLLVNYLADVLPLKRTFSRQPVCQKCHRLQGWGDYLLFRKCKTCQKARSVRAVIVQGLLPIVFVFLWLNPPERLGFWISAWLVLYFSLVAVIDIEHHIIMHPVSVTGAFTGFGIGYLLHGIWPTLIGGVAGFLIMLLLYYGGAGFAKLLSRIRKQPIGEVALGFGDVNLGGILGLILGWPGITAGLVIAIIVGGIFSAGYLIWHKIAGRYEMFTAIPYAPFLIIGALTLLFRP